MKRMYRASYGWNNRIEPVNVIKETDKNVFLETASPKPDMWKKESNYYKFAETFEEAKQWLINRYAFDVQQAESKLNRAKTNLEAVSNLSE